MPELKLYKASVNGSREFVQAYSIKHAEGLFRRRALERFGRYKITGTKEVERTIPLVPGNRKAIQQLTK
jgi:hypothetical protein